MKSTTAKYKFTQQDHHIPYARIGPCIGLIGVCVGSMRLFRYQHIGIEKHKLLPLGVQTVGGPTQMSSHFGD